LTVLAVAIFMLGGSTIAQVFLPPPPPAHPADYGEVILDNFASKSPGAVVFDHWLHRSRFTCRLCHVDVGFAMKAKATGITAESNRQGFRCGACHDGKKIFDGKPLFAACSQGPANSQCDRCHSLDKKGVRQFEYESFTATFPKSIYGINWEAAERTGKVKPVDSVEGITMKKTRIQSREDFTLKTSDVWVHPVLFSHKKHSVWNGCELCHPEIFPTVKKSSVQYTMSSNLEGHHCGACHLKVAFPLNSCSRCHPRAPTWAQQ